MSTWKASPQSIFTTRQYGHGDAMDAEEYLERSLKMDDAFGNWFAGFTDGEGSFTARVAKLRPKKGNHIEIDVEFSICLRDDDTEILREINKRLKLNGKFTHYGELTNSQGITSKPRVHYSIRRIKNCLRLIEIFDRHPLRAKKARDYAIWREIIFELKKLPRGNKWHGPTDRTHIINLAQDLKEVRKYESFKSSTQED